MNGENKISEHTSPKQSFEGTVLYGLAANKQIILEKVCDVTDGTQSYPIICVRSQSYDISKPTVLLTAGIHGDEPAGVHAIIQFLNSDLSRYEDRFNILALPCINPSGFDTGMHNTASGLNINDHFGRQSGDTVVRAIETKLKSLRPPVFLSFDLHEDNSGDQLGCYAYQTISKGTDSIAHRVLEVLEPTDICQQPIIYGEKNTSGVIDEVVDASQEAHGSLHWFLKANGTQHAMTIETPNMWPLEKRVKAYLAMIHRGLESI